MLDQEHVSTKCKEGMAEDLVHVPNLDSFSVLKDSHCLRHSTIHPTPLHLALPSLSTAASLHSLLVMLDAGQHYQLCLRSTLSAVPQVNIISCASGQHYQLCLSSPNWQLPFLLSLLHLTDIRHWTSLAMTCYTQLARPHVLCDADRTSWVKESVWNLQAINACEEGTSRQNAWNRFLRQNYSVSFHSPPDFQI